MKWVLCCQKENSNKNPAYILRPIRLKLLPDYLTSSPKSPIVLHQAPLSPGSTWSLTPGATVCSDHPSFYLEKDVTLSPYHYQVHSSQNSISTLLFPQKSTTFLLIVFGNFGTCQQSLEHSPPCFQYHSFIGWSSFSQNRSQNGHLLALPFSWKVISNQMTTMPAMRLTQGAKLNLMCDPSPTVYTVLLRHNTAQSI